MLSCHSYQVYWHQLWFYIVGQCLPPPREWQILPRPQCTAAACHRSRCALLPPIPCAQFAEKQSEYALVTNQAYTTDLSTRREVDLVAHHNNANLRIVREFLDLSYPSFHVLEWFLVSHLFVMCVCVYAYACVQMHAYMWGACIHANIHASFHAQKRILDLSPTCSQHMHTQNQIANLIVITYAQTIGSHVHFRTRAGKGTRTSKLLVPCTWR